MTRTELHPESVLSHAASIGIERQSLQWRTSLCQASISNSAHLASARLICCAATWGLQLTAVAGAAAPSINGVKWTECLRGWSKIPLHASILTATFRSFSSTQTHITWMPSSAGPQSQTPQGGLVPGINVKKSYSTPVFYWLFFIKREKGGNTCIHVKCVVLVYF